MGNTTPTLVFFLLHPSVVDAYYLWIYFSGILANNIFHPYLSVGISKSNEARIAAGEIVVFA
jgi:hypothetical protein